MGVKSFVKDESGGPAVEFGLVAPMLIALMIATVQVGYIGLMSNNLDMAVTAAARKIRTGSAPTNASSFMDSICATMVDKLADCRSRLRIAVQKASNFTNASAQANAAPGGQYDAGDAGDIILVRATYRLPMLLPLYTGGFEPAGPRDALIDARAAFRNEPYE